MDSSRNNNDFRFSTPIPHSDTVPIKLAYIRERDSPVKGDLSLQFSKVKLFDSLKPNFQTDLTKTIKYKSNLSKASLINANYDASINSVNHKNNLSQSHANQ